MRGLSGFAEDAANTALALVLPEVLSSLAFQKGNTRVEPTVEAVGDGGRVQVNADYLIKRGKAIVSGFVGYQWIDSFLKGIGGLSFGTNLTFYVWGLRVSLRMVASPWSAISLKQLFVPWFTSPYVVRNDAGGRVQVNVDNVMRLCPLASVGGLAGYEWVGPSPSKGSRAPYIGGRLQVFFMGIPILFELTVAKALSSLPSPLHEEDLPAELEPDTVVLDGYWQ